MREISLVVLCVLLSVSTNLYAQKIDTNYIDERHDKLMIGTIFRSRNNFWTFKNDANPTNMELKHNPSVNFGLGVNWRFLVGSFEYGLLNIDTTKYGNTNRLDLKLSPYLGPFMLSFQFSKYKGYYIANPNELDTKWQVTDVYPHLPNTTTHNIVADVKYFLNRKRLSPKAAFVLSDKQIKSAGSVIAGTYYTYLSVDKTKDIHVPQGFLPFVLPRYMQFLGVKSHNMGISLGYMYSFVFGVKKYWSLNAMFNAGLGATYQDLPETLSASRNAWSLTERLDYRLALNYNAPHFYGAIIGESNVNYIDPKTRISLTSVYTIVSLIVGYRF